MRVSDGFTARAIRLKPNLALFTVHTASLCPVGVGEDPLQNLDLIQSSTKSGRDYSCNYIIVTCEINIEYYYILES